MRLLVVEDDHKIAKALKRGLEAEKFAVDVEHDGQAGYLSAKNTDYDLILLDWMLPSLDGDKICELLRKEKIDTPILMLTAKGAIGHRVSGLNAGADDYLPKPFSFDELLARVRALLRRPSKLQAKELEVGDLKLNTLSFSASRGGQEIKLTSKEYALLEYLMRNKGQILSKDNLISHVWNFDSDVLPNNVEVYMGYLRNKIDKPFNNKLLHTVRGFGYKIEDK